MALDYDEFIATVESEGAVSREEAERAVQATLRTLAERLSGGEVEDIARQLPQELRPWLHDGAKAEPFDLEEFLRRVADREGVPAALAEDHARLVFAALGRTLTPDELKDMVSELPTSFDELIEEARRQSIPGQALELGNAESHGAARRLSLDEFLLRVAKREGVTVEAAREHARAVFRSLREAIPDKEFRDTAAQLPKDFTVLMARP